ncbi:MAG: hypothetical protein KJO07_24055, partial [Deltaproteobacteria bacterium]|nr:hypothetical protein [Deltaproteobacteria bacterium]
MSMKQVSVVIALLLLLPACDKGESSDSAGNDEGGGTAESDTAKPAAKAPASKASDDNAPAIAADPTFKPLGDYVLSAGKALERHVRTNKGEEAWGILPDSPRTAEVGTKLKALGSAKMLFVVVELEALGKSKYLRTQAVVFPNGRVAWMQLNLRNEPASVRGTARLADIAPAMAKGIDDLIRVMGSDKCSSLPTVQAGEVASLPPRGQAGMLRGAKILAANCPFGTKGEQWIPRIDDVTVAFQAGSKVAAIRSSFDVRDGKIRL